ncbi:MAG: FtsX-like permease family protein [Myxococcales bacterium]|nr:FtsX-like permease family protein [Myxococcales bacterium]USN50525.1 MAG: FtsX-like permease family protein [Myxococcales bacterium]
MVSELFYQSAIINAMVFLWLASALSTARIMLRCDRGISVSLLMALFFGPLAMIAAWLYEAWYFKKQSKKLMQPKQTLRVYASIFLASIFAIALFHWFYVSNSFQVTTSSEALMGHIGIFLIIVGFLCGSAHALITHRVAFFETCWTTFFLSLYALSLGEWANNVFSYGTSLAYFSALTLTANFLFFIFSTLGGALGYLFCGERRINFSYGYEFFIGMRFLMTKRSSQVVSLISVISVFAVMIACCGMIVVMGVMNGFTFDLRTKILGANPHLMVLKYGKDFREYKDIVQKTKDLTWVVSASPFIVNEAMISKDKNLSSALITGIDLNNSDKTHLLRYVSQETLNYLNHEEKIPVVHEINMHGNLGKILDDKVAVNELPGVILGKEMAKELQVFVGDSINIISPIGDIGPTGPIPKAKAFRVAGFFDSGMYEYDAKFAYIKLEAAQEFFNLKSLVTGIEYRLSDVEKTREVALQIDNAIGGYPFYTRDWMQMNRNMFSALQLEKIAMLIILGTLIFMASLLILVTLIMVVMEKGKEIAILKSMGATDASVMKIFVSYGLFVGGLGAILGGMLGLGICWLIDKIGIRLDSDIYYFSKIPVRIESVEILLVILAAIIISFLATIPPSLFAARLKPVEGLRYE